MFNILTDKLPDFVTVDGEKCLLNTDFKVWINFEIILSDKEKSDVQKLAEILPLCFRKLPSNIEKAWQACTKFYCGGERKKGEGEKTFSRPLYSFKYDAGLIFSAFYEKYNIDLNERSMHWFKFRQLFLQLGNGNSFDEVLQSRCVSLSDIKDPMQKKKMMALKRIYALPDIRTEQEKNNDIVCALESIF